MVNTNFYLAMGELYSRATNGQISATQIVDYDTFVDAGKVLADMEIEQLHNGFLAPLMNKVQKTIYDTPSYIGALTSMYAGTLNYGILEQIMGDFYTMSASTFDGETLVDGETYTDQFEVSLPKVTTRYYTNSVSYGKTITIRDTDLRGAFKDPEAMDGFIRKIFLDIANSSEMHKEVNRLAVLADIIKECAGVTAEVADENKVAINYNILAIYNEKMGTELTKENCLYNNDFVTFFCSTVRDIAALMQKPNDKMNVIGEITTFSPNEYQSLKLASIADKAIRRSLVDAFNPEYGMITGDYEVIPYWQNIADRLRVTTTQTLSDGTVETNYSPSVLAVLIDKRSCGEMVQLEDVTTTRNAKRRYTNYHWAFNYMYWTNFNANTIIFTIG